MSSEPLRIGTSEVEVTNISAHGVWLLAGEQENFLSYQYFLLFNCISIEKFLNVREPAPRHFHWPDSGDDLGGETIRHPGRYPLRARFDK